MRVFFIIFLCLFLGCSEIPIKNRALEIQGVFLSRDIVVPATTTNPGFTIAYGSDVWKNAYVRLDLIPSNFDSITDRTLVGKYNVIFTRMRQYDADPSRYVVADSGDFSANLSTEKIKFTSTNLTADGLAILQVGLNGEYDYNSMGYEIGENLSISFTNHPFFNTGVRNNFTRFASYKK